MRDKSMLDYLWSWITPFWVTSYVLVNLVPVLAMMRSKRSYVGTKELNEKYAAFARTDLQYWNFLGLTIRCLLTGASLRFLFGYFFVVMPLLLVATLATLG